MDQVIFAKFSDERNSSFQLSTKILIDSMGEKYALKKAKTGNANRHLQQMAKKNVALQEAYRANSRIEIVQPIAVTKQNELVTVTYPFLDFPRLSTVLEKKLQINFNSYQKLICDFYDNIKSIENKVEFRSTKAFEDVFGNIFFKETIIASPILNIDATFENIFISGNEDDFIYNIIDTEWTFEFPIPLGYSIYRSLITSMSFSQLTDEKKNKMWTVLDISKDELDQFEKMDKSFQKYVKGQNPLEKNYSTLLEPALDIRYVDIESYFIKPYTISNGIKEEMFYINSVSGYTIAVHGGKIKFSPIGEGKGAVFRLKDLYFKSPSGVKKSIDKFIWNGLCVEDIYYATAETFFLLESDKEAMLGIDFVILYCDESTVDSLQHLENEKIKLVEKANFLEQEILNVGDQKNQEIELHVIQFEKIISELTEKIAKYEETILSLGDDLQNIKVEKSLIEQSAHELEYKLDKITTSNIFKRETFIRSLNKNNNS